MYCYDSVSPFEIFGCGEAVGTVCRLHGAQDGLGHNAGGKSADHVLVGSQIAQRDCVDASLTGPLPPEARRELLLRMRTACENNTAVLRIVSAEAFPLDPHITVTAFRGRSVVFCTLSDDPQEGFCREYTLRDAMLANRLADYMSNLKDSSLVCTQRYTLEYIDFCLRLL